MSESKNDSAAKASADSAAKASAGPTVCRMLRDTVHESGDKLCCGELITAPAAVIAGMVESGAADSEQAAVDYCKSQGVKPRKIKKPKPEEVADSADDSGDLVTE